MNLDQIIGNEALRNFGVGAFVGFTLGFTLKRFFKMFIFLIGLYILSLLFLQNHGVIQLNPDTLANWVNSLFESFSNFVKGMITPVSSLAGFTIGFAVGWKT